MIVSLRAARIAAVATVVAAQCAAIPSARADAPLRIGATGNDTAAVVYYADEMGFFKKHGVAVTIQNLPSGSAEASAVAGNALDIGEQNVVSMSRAHERSLPFVYIAPSAEYNANASTTSLIVAKASTVKSGKDLEGKTVAVNALGDLAQIGAEAWIEKHGGDLTKVKFIEMTPIEIGAAVARGTIDAGVITEPALTGAKEGGAVRVLAQPYDAIAPHFMINGWFTTSDWVKKNPAAAKNFAAAIGEAAVWANAHRAESAKIFAKHSKVEPAVIDRMTRATYGRTLDAKDMQSVIDAAVRYQGLKKPFPAQELIDVVH
jgi:NitT/TauT family transport system substrate-binding protein